MMRWKDPRRQNLRPERRRQGTPPGARFMCLASDGWRTTEAAAQALWLRICMRTEIRSGSWIKDIILWKEHCRDAVFFLCQVYRERMSEAFSGLPEPEIFRVSGRKEGI